MFDFRLKVFHAVAQRLNFTKAAEELFITQPAVTKHIKEIEKHFNTKLFDRNGTKIQLTHAGELLLKHTHQIFDIYRNLEIDMNALNSKHSGQLRIGASTTVAQYVLPPMMANFYQRFPDVAIKLKSGNTEEIENTLLANDIDLGIIEGESRKSHITYTPFIKDEIVLVSRIGSPLAKESITLKQLLKTNLLLREQGSGTLEVLTHALKNNGLNMNDLKVEMELNSTESIKLYLLNSDCMAFLSVHSILKELAANEFCIVDVKDLNIERYFYIIQPQGEANSLSKLFLSFANRYNLR